MKVTEWLAKIKPVAWLVGKFAANGARRSVDENRPPPVEELAVELDGTRPTVLLWAPVYKDDDPTHYTSAWLQDLKDTFQFQGYVVSGPLSNRQDALNSLDETRNVPRIKVFCGHGKEDSLLGPPHRGSDIVVLGTLRHSIWYHESMIEPKGEGQSSLFAFCCRTGNQFGSTFGASPNRFFLGYTVDLPLELTEREYEEAYRRIIHTIVSEIVSDGSVSKKHKTRLKRLYADELDQLRRPKDFMMAAHLLEHRNGVRFCGGT